MELHVFNGDCAAEMWKHTPFASTPGTECLVWRENYLIGDLPPERTSCEVFSRLRARALHASLPEHPEDALFESLVAMERSLEPLSDADSVVLWFDACMFDQTMLCRVLFLLRNVPCPVRLVCKNTIWGNSPDDFSSEFLQSQPLSNEDISLFADSWRALTRGELALREILRDTHRFQKFPFLRKGLARFLEDFPDADGLSRSERQLLAIVRSGNSTLMQIFPKFDPYEEFQFLGDTHCVLLLDGLVRKGLLSSEKSGEHILYHSA